MKLKIRISMKYNMQTCCRARKRRNACAYAFHVITDTCALVSINFTETENKFVVDKSRVCVWVADFILAQSIASVGSFTTWTGPWCRESADKSKGETIFEQMRAISLRETWMACRRGGIRTICIILRHSTRTREYVRATNVLPSKFSPFLFARKLQCFLLESAEQLVVDRILDNF